MATSQDIKTLRVMVSEPDTTVYSDLDLGSIIDQAEGDLDKSAAMIWEQKAGRFSTLVDVSESGSSRKMSQIHDNAMKQAKYYADKIASATQVVPEVPRPRTRTAVRK